VYEAAAAVAVVDDVDDRHLHLLFHLQQNLLLDCLLLYWSLMESKEESLLSKLMSLTKMQNLAQ
jgi:hypothetical protein